MDNLDCVKGKNRLAKELMEVLKLKNQLNHQKQKRRIFWGSSGSKKFGPFPPAGMILVQFKFNRKVHHAGEHPGNQAGCIKGVYLLVALVPALKFDDASGQVGVNEAGRHVVKVHSKTHTPLCHYLIIPQKIFSF